MSASPEDPAPSRSYGERPRVHAKVVARRHLSEGREVVMLHDHQSHRLMCLEAVQWEVAALADGTRDATGVALAARALGIGVPPGHLHALFTTLAMNGMLTEGPTAPWVMPPPKHEALFDEPLDAFEIALACDGDGICCRTFASVMFLPLEVARARVTLPTLDAGWTPHEGVDMSGPRSPALHEGRCAFLEDASGACRLHAAGGEDAKPAGCRTFPNYYVHDGARVRVSCSLECGCVLRSLRDDGHAGAPLVPAGATLRDVPRPVAVRALPERVPVGRGRSLSREQTRELLAVLGEGGVPSDAARALWGWADALEAGVERSAIDAVEPPRDQVAPRLEALAQTLAEWGPPMEAFRGADDLTRLGMRWVRLAAEALLEGDRWPAPTDPKLEAACVRAEAHGLLYALDGSLTDALRRRAIRFLIARVLPRFAKDDRRASEPIALVEALFRGHGFDTLIARPLAPDASAS